MSIMVMHYCNGNREGVKKLDKVLTPSALGGKYTFFSFVINILLEPELRLGVTIQKKRVLQGMLNIFYILSKNFFLTVGGSTPPP